MIREIAWKGLLWAARICESKNLFDCLLLWITINYLHFYRLIISRWRGVTDHSLRSIIQNCKNLSQLDLVGIKNITGDVCEKALVYLKDLELLEVSFCDGIRNEQVRLSTAWIQAIILNFLCCRSPYGESNFLMLLYKEVVRMLQELNWNIAA